MISVDRICILEILDHVRLKFVVFTIREMIWRVFLLWTNYRHYSNMINVDCICISKILDNVRFVMVNFSLFPFVIKFGAISVFNQIIDKILIWLMWIISTFSWFLFMLGYDLPFSLSVKWFGAFSIFDQIIDTILIWSMWIVFLFPKFLFVLGWNLPFSLFLN